jgi:muramoyltetrapeptide carboxypeptidase
MSLINRRNAIRALGLGGLTLLWSRTFSLEKKAQVPNPEKTFAPPKLPKGGTIGLVAPAGPIYDPKSLDALYGFLSSEGFKVKKGRSLEKVSGYFAGTDKERAEDLMEMFRDKSVNAIIAAKGGYGSARILEFLDFEFIKSNPKALLGFSDITALLNAITFKTGLITFHGPTGNTSWNTFSQNSFKKAVMDQAPQILDLNDPGVQTWNLKTFSGRIYGGNLSVLCSLLGTHWFPEAGNAVYILEETTEEPFRIDRMLNQLKQAGVSGKATGLLFGKCTKCVAEEPAKSFTAAEVFSDSFSNLETPVIAGLPFGHTPDKLTIPIGGKASLRRNLSGEYQLELVF